MYIKSDVINTFYTSFTKHRETTVWSESMKCDLSVDNPRVLVCSLSDRRHGTQFHHMII